MLSHNRNCQKGSMVEDHKNFYSSAPASICASGSISLTNKFRRDKNETSYRSMHLGKLSLTASETLIALINHTTLA